LIWLRSDCSIESERKSCGRFSLNKMDEVDQYCALARLPKTSMSKSVKYNLPKLTENLTGNRKARATARISS